MSMIKSEIKMLAVVRDKYGRICLDEGIFFDNERLLEFAEAVKNGCDSRDSGSKRDR